MQRINKNITLQKSSNNLIEDFNNFTQDIENTLKLEYVALFNLNKEYFLFELNLSNKEEYIEKIDEDFEFLHENGVITKLLNVENIQYFPEIFDNKENNFIVIPIVSDNGIENIIIINYKDNSLQKDKINQHNLSLLINNFVLNFNLNIKNKKINELDLILSEYKNTNIKGLFNESELVSSILNSIKAGVIIANKESGLIYKTNKLAEKIINYNQEELTDKYINNFLNFQNIISDNHYESKISNKSGLFIDILRNNSTTFIDGVEYLVESFVEISEQKKLHNLLISKNTDLENVVNTKTKDLNKTIEDLEKSIEFRKIAEENIENEKKYSELKTKFLLMVSHEFRTPLTVIRNNIEIIRNYQNQLTNDQFVHYSSRIISSLDFISTILLNINKYQEEVNNTVVKENFINLTEYVNLKISELTKRSAKPIFIDINLPSEYKIEYSIETISPIFENLIDNIYKYSKDIVLAEIYIIPDDEYHIFEFYDKGMGIPPNDISRIEEIFYRGKNAIHIPGVGMGLAVVSKILNFINGKIIINSIENLETKVTIKLPKLININKNLNS